MGRPVSKIDKRSLRFMIDNSGRISFAKMAKHLGVHHTTVLHWVNKLRNRGIVVKSIKAQSDADALIDDLKKDLKI